MFRIKEYINENNITSKTLAEELGVNQNTISRIVNGSSNPSLDLLIKIAEYFNVDVKDLFVSTKEKSTKELINELRYNLDELEKKLLN